VPLNERAPRQERSETSGRRPPERTHGYGRPAPALVIRIEVRSAPSVVADWDDDQDADQFTSWLAECPRIASLAHLACQLSDELAA
jgi:hypothetical protein